MNCGDIKLKLSQHAEVSPTDAAAIEAHLMNCGPCRALVLDLETQTERWFTLLGQTEARPPVALLTMIRSNTINPSWKPSQFWQTRRPIYVGLAALVMALIWIGITRQSPQADQDFRLAHNPPISATASLVIAQDHPSLTPIATVNRDNPTNLPLTFTVIPTSDLVPLATQTIAPPMLANPLPTSIRPSLPPTEVPITLPTEVPIVTQEPLPTEVPLPPTEVPLPTNKPEPITALPTEIQQSPEIPTRIPPSSQPMVPTAPPTAIGTPAPPTAIGTPAPPTAIGTPAPPTAIGTLIPTATPSPTSMVIPATPSSTAKPLDPTPTPNDQSTKR
ncbi:zf-HC2 domain-containing protein [Herpetosiphon gulosus]|uniref:Putative zinc-finger domain-containing protein n=1 Tax=Herpetosiphon gulosus TaxID=1973496 RepID=A0ABP9X424_9CHLR